MKKQYLFLLIFFFMFFIEVNVFADGKTKVIDEVGTVVGKNLGKYIESLARYFGIFGLLVFMKVVSWTKMLFGGFLSIVGVFFPVRQEDKGDRGEAKISKGTFNLFVKGSLKFVLVIAGLILIVASVFEGVDSTNRVLKEDNNSTSIAYGFIGIQYTINEKGSLTISNIIENSPAQNAGIGSGDIITRIDDVQISAAMKIEDIKKLLQGQVGSKIELEIEHDGKRHPVTIQRVAIPNSNE